MAAFDGEVRRAVVAEQRDLLDHAEHCSADLEALAAIGRGIGHQVRLRLAEDPSVFALYTVGQGRDEAPQTVVRMGLGGRLRLGTAEPFAAVVDSVVPLPRISDTEAARRHEFVERLSDDGTHRGLIAVAPHGGDIEPHTDTQAEHLAEQLAAYGVSTWRCKGFMPHGGAARLFHISSTDLHEASFPGLGSVIGRGFRHAVAFHGSREEEVLVGGGATFRLRAEIAAAVEGALSGSGIRVRIAGPDDVLGGDSPRNVVNRLTASGRGGVHLEQGPRARAEHGFAIAEAVADVFARRLHRAARAGRKWWWRWEP